MQTRCTTGITEKKLRYALLLTSVILIAEVVGGVVFRSLALLSDAAHVFSDAFALTLSWFAVKLAAKPPSTSRTFGFHRTEIFAALLNGALLLALTFLIFYKAYTRILTPVEVKSTGVLVVAIIGFSVNLWVLSELKEHHHGDLNIRSAFLHVLGDALASVGVIIGAVIMIFTGQYIVDPIISIFIGVIILMGSIRVIRESAHILLEGAPSHINVEDIKKAIFKLSGVKGIHDFHMWSICSNVHAASAHILVDDLRIKDMETLKGEVNKIMEGYDVLHTTFQFEYEECKET